MTIHKGKSQLKWIGDVKRAGGASREITGRIVNYTPLREDSGQEMIITGLS